MSAPDTTVQIAAQSRTLVQVFARRGRAAELTAILLASHGLTLPPPGQAATAGDMSALWVQPECWLLTTPRGAEGTLGTAIKEACGNAGSVIDQTHGRVVLRLSGPGAPRVLAKLCRVDLHPRVFTPGTVAVTPVAEVSCILHLVDAALNFDVFAPATFSGSLRDMLSHAAAEFGHGHA